VKRRLALLLIPATLGIGALQALPARASAPPPAPTPKVNVSAGYAACAGNFRLRVGVCIPWTL